MEREAILNTLGPQSLEEIIITIIIITVIIILLLVSLFTHHSQVYEKDLVSSKYRARANQNGT